MSSSALPFQSTAEARPTSTVSLCALVGVVAQHLTCSRSSADAYGPLVAYLFSWTAVTLLKPGSAAIIALIFGEYVMRLIYSSSVSAETAEGSASVPGEAPEWTFKLLGCLSACSALPFAADCPQLTYLLLPDAVVLVVTGINLANARAGAHVQVGLTTIKVRCLAA